MAGRYPPSSQPGYGGYGRPGAYPGYPPQQQAYPPQQQQQQQAYYYNGSGGYPPQQQAAYGNQRGPGNSAQYPPAQTNRRTNDVRQQLEQLQRYLGQVLSQGGREALPYEEQAKYVVRQHILDLVSEFPSLSVSVTGFTHNDGRDVKILKIGGTAPMYFQGKKYNLPLTIWLLEGYPRAPPRAYLTPTSDMIIKSNHRFVDASGCVRSPYLDQWSYPASNLRDLTTTLCIRFGEDPPLYAKPPNWRPDGHTGQQAYAQRPGAGAYAYGTQAAAGNPGTFHGYNPMVSQPQQAQQQQQQGAGGSVGSMAAAGRPPVVGGGAEAVPSAAPNTDPPAKVFKAQASDALARRVLKTLQAIERHTSQSIDDRLGEQQILEERAAKLGHVAQALAKERDMIDGCIHKYESKTLELENWLDKHREIDKDIEADLDGVFVPSDPLSAQAIKEMAKDAAIEDAMYSLEQALLNDALDPIVYLKQIRSLSRKQFYHRKLCMKIAETQKQQEALQQSRPRTVSGSSSQQQPHDLGDWEILQDLNLNKK